MAKHNPDERMERFNVVLSLDEVTWLDQLAQEIAANNGAKVSRSEIIRAAVAILRELHNAAPRCPARFRRLAQCRSGSELVIMGSIAVYWATKTMP